MAVGCCLHRLFVAKLSPKTFTGYASQLFDTHPAANQAKNDSQVTSKMMQKDCLQHTHACILKTSCPQKEWQLLQQLAVQ